MHVISLLDHQTLLDLPRPEAPLKHQRLIVLRG